MSGETSIYIHIPFCSHKCPYCHFYVLHDKEILKDLLLEALLLEWSRIVPPKKIASIYFGGGTPALFGAHRLERVLKAMGKQEVEITIEANPENSSEELFKSLLDIGCNRLSLGIQSLDPIELQFLGRKHTPEKALWAVETAYKAGFNNISCDLMYDTPKQTMTSWHHTLEKTASLPITHISLYNLTIESNTPFAQKETQLRLLLPDEVASAQMYTDAQQLLQETGFSQYEVSAFARNDRRSYHNIGYWIGRPFIGLGPSAWSYRNGKRFQNIPNLVRYAQALKEGQSTIEEEDTATTKELLAIHLRLLDGCDRRQFAIDASTQEALDRLEQKGLIVQEGSKIAITSKGILFYDTVAVELI